MPEESLPKPETDLPLPEKELTSGEENPIHPIVRNENPPKEGRHLIRAFLLGFLFVIILAAIGGAYFFGKSKTNTKTISESPSPTSAEQTQQANTNFFYFSIPKPYDKLTLDQLPRNGRITGAVVVGDKLWYTGGGSIIEHDINSGKMVAYSDAKKGDCNYGNIIYLKGYIYAICSVKDLDYLSNEFAGHNNFLDSRQGVYKIDPQKHELVRVFTPKDGLKNTSNYTLTPDGDYIWITTFKGLGRINTTNDKVDFYHDELGIGGTQQGVNNIFIDGDHVWAIIPAHAESLGGLSLYNRATNTWAGYDSTKIKDYDTSRFDLEFSENGNAIKKVPGGIQIAFRDGQIGSQDRLSEKKYDYSTGKWTKVNEMPTTGDAYEASVKYLKTNYPSTKVEYSFVDQNGKLQIKLPNTNKVYKIDGRENMLMGPMIDDKRIVFTNSSIDFVNDDYPFRQTLINFNDAFGVGAGGNGAIYDYLVDDSGGNKNMAVIIDSDCAGMGCGTNQKIWLIDLEKGKIIKTYTNTDGIPDPEKFDAKLTMSSNGKLLVVANEKGEIFSINLENNKLTNLSN